MYRCVSIYNVLSIPLTRTYYCNTMKLYIIGNGFDLAHQQDGKNNFKTSYKDFRCFVRNKLHDSQLHTLSARELYDFIDKLPTIGENWCNFEDALAYMDYNVMYDLLCCHKNKLKLTTIDGIMEAVRLDLNETFKTWVGSINTNGVKVYNIEVDGNFFLTFNYTDTLEKHYHIHEAKICHVHAKDQDETHVYERLIFGHGLSNSQIKRLNPDYCETNNKSNFVYGLCDFRKDYHNCTISNGYRKMKNFCNQVEEVIIIGHGLGDADLYYFDDIGAATENVPWHYYGFEVENNEKEYRRKLSRLCHPVQLHDEKELHI